MARIKTFWLTPPVKEGDAWKTSAVFVATEDGNVDVYLNSELVGSSVVRAHKRVDIPITINQVGVYVPSAHFTESARGTSVDADSSRMIIKEAIPVMTPPVLEFSVTDPRQVGPNWEFQGIALVSNSKSEPIEGQKIDFCFDGSPVPSTEVTNASGRLAKKFCIPVATHPSGSFKVEAQVHATTVARMKTVVFPEAEVKPPPQIRDFRATTPTLSGGEWQFEVSVLVASHDNSPAAGLNIELRVSNRLQGALPTMGDGRVTFTLALPRATYLPGNHWLQATIENTAITKATPLALAEAKVPPPPVPELEFSLTAPVKAGDEWKFNGIALAFNPGRVPLDAAQIDFTVNGTDAGFAFTEASGQAVREFTLLAGIYRIAAQVNGTAVTKAKTLELKAVTAEIVTITGATLEMDQVTDPTMPNAYNLVFCLTDSTKRAIAGKKIFLRSNLAPGAPPIEIETGLDGTAVQHIVMPVHRGAVTATVPDLGVHETFLVFH